MKLLLEAWLQEYQNQRLGKRNLKMGSPQWVGRERVLKLDAKPYREPMPKGWDEKLQKAREQLSELNKR